MKKKKNSSPKEAKIWHKLVEHSSLGRSGAEPRSLGISRMWAEGHGSRSHGSWSLLRRDSSENICFLHPCFQTPISISTKGSRKQCPISVAKGENLPISLLTTQSADGKWSVCSSGWGWQNQRVTRILSDCSKCENRKEWIKNILRSKTELIKI